MEALKQEFNNPRFQSDMRRFSEQFKLNSDPSNLLGEGSFGAVIKALHRQTGTYVAIKISKEDSKSIDNEYWTYDAVKVHSLGRLPNPHIPEIFGHGRIGKVAYLAMDLLGPNLDVLYRRKRFKNKTLAMLGVQILDGLGFLHRSGIIHSDVKGNNFAISATDPSKINMFEFGLSRQIGRVYSFRGSLAFASIGTHAGEPAIDFESLGYLLADYRRELPWRRRRLPDDSEAAIKVGLHLKMKKEIFEMTPGFFALTLYLMHIHAQANPSRNVLKGFFLDMLEKWDNPKFDWERISSFQS